MRKNKTKQKGLTLTLYMHQLGYHHRLGYQFSLHYISASQTGQGTMRICIDFFLLRYIGQ